jgi:hypothetical protein
VTVPDRQDPPDLAFSIAARFNGPPASANGGYACGTLAGLAAPAFGPRVTVSLHSPPPLDAPLSLRIGPRRGHALHGDSLLATVAPSATPIAVVDAVEPRTALQAQEAYTGHVGHPFPTCFVCGTDREPGDGLLLRPGRVPGRTDLVACVWTPDESVAGPGGAVRPEVVWSVLDCPGGWTGDPAREPAVLGRMTARIDAAPRIGEQCVVVGRLENRSEHTAVNTTALYGPGGNLLGLAEALWLRADPGL